MAIVARVICIVYIKWSSYWMYCISLVSTYEAKENLTSLYLHIPALKIIVYLHFERLMQFHYGSSPFHKKWKVYMIPVSHRHHSMLRSKTVGHECPLFSTKRTNASDINGSLRARHCATRQHKNLIVTGDEI